MKKLLTILLIIAINGSLLAEINVKSFRKLDNDLDARVNEPLKDQNGDVCAIIKVVTTQTGFSFDCGQIGVVKTVPKTSEIWVYVPFGAKRITISHPQLGLLRDYLFQIPIEKATVYELVITTGKVITTVDETIESQWLVINPDPTDASIYINDLFVKSGAYQAKHKPGNYSYRIEAPLYHNEAGMVEISDQKKEINVKLKPAFGYLDITSSPEPDARVAIDGKFISQRTPCQSDALASGEHTVQIIKEMFEPSTQKVKVSDGQTTPVALTMSPTFADVNISSQSDATIYINNEKKSTGTWVGRLNAGIYSIEARKPSYSPAKQDIEVLAGEKKNFNLEPTPIYGSLNVITKPSGAMVTIDGKTFKVTPYAIDSLLIGDHMIELSRQNFLTVVKTITIEEGKVTQLNEQLTRGHAAVVKPVPVSTPVNTPIQNNSVQNQTVANNPAAVTGAEKNTSIPITTKDTPTSSNNTVRNRSFQNIPAQSNPALTINPAPATQSVLTINGSSTNNPIENKIPQSTTANSNTTPQKQVNTTTESVKETPILVQRLKISSAPIGAELFIDSIKVGSTPFNVSLTLGNHHLKLILGIQKFETTITVTQSRDDAILIYDLSPKSFTETVNGLSFDMIAVKGGSFRMGSNEGQKIERPVHTVTIDPFYLCSSEVTQALYKSLIDFNPSKNQGDDLPVEKVTWNDTQEFIQKLNQITGKKYRLPTEAEWEYAASTDPTGLKNTWAGTDIDRNLADFAWYEENSGGKTHPVKQKKANQRGLYDMTGNVWEWCSDWYDLYSGGSHQNPTGPATGKTKVNRGGGWDDDEVIIRTTNRDDNGLDEPFGNVGFRLALSTK